MINYKQILEAVNRGIKFALDDFEDNEQIQGQVNNKVKYQGGWKEYLDLMNDVVDLGLPSGTLWCKYNLGVNSKQLSKPEDWYGSYYAWGELEGNKTNEDGEIYFSWDNYKFGKSNALVKYCNNHGWGLNGFADNLTQLLPEDDVAYQKKKLHNFKFHIPTKEQCEELIKYTKNYWVNNYNPNNMVHHINDDGIQGLNGRIFEGKNGNQLFIPATGGYRLGSNIYDVGSGGCLWSSSLNLINPTSAHYLDIDVSFITMYVGIRYSGFGVRPVINL